MFEIFFTIFVVSSLMSFFAKQKEKYYKKEEEKAEMVSKLEDGFYDI